MPEIRDCGKLKRELIKDLMLCAFIRVSNIKTLIDTQAEPKLCDNLAHAIFQTEGDDFAPTIGMCDVE